LLPARRGCDKTFTEHASGTLARRPALDEVLSYLRAGDTLVVTKLDRLGRSVRNLKQIADDLQARQVGLRAVSQGIDTTTPGGRLFFHMLAAIAEFEHDLIVERTHDGLAAARARGRKGGPRFKMTLAAPIGTALGGPLVVAMGAPATLLASAAVTIALGLLATITLLVMKRRPPRAARPAKSGNSAPQGEPTGHGEAL